MVNAQEWLDNEYPLAERDKITRLDIISEELTGELKLEGFSNLTKLNCANNNLTNLDLSNLSNLTELWCSNNNLTNDLSIFSKLTNLERLLIGNDNEERIKAGIYNRFAGSLEPLKNLTKLKILCIEATDVDSGLEYLPDSLNEAQYVSDTKPLSRMNASNTSSRIYCSPDNRLGSKVAKIKEQLKPFNYNLGKWKAANKELVAKVKQQTNQINSLTQELTEIKSKLAVHDTNLTTTRSLLDKANSELTNKNEELVNLQKELDNQVEFIGSIDDLHDRIRIQKQELITLTQELNKLKTQSENKDQTIKEKEAAITAQHQQIVISNRELDQLKADYQTQQTKITELESQLTGLALSSSLLVNQVEDLTNQKTQSEQETERISLAKEISDNLLTSKENELKNKDNTISQQATQIITYQNIIRQSEANLAKAQAIILTKTEQLEHLEQERDSLAEKLAQAEEAITNLEQSLLTSQTKISELETKIKGLELNLTNDDNKSELVNLKQQLAHERTNSKQQITQLRTQLTNLKTKEAQLSAQIKKLTTKQEQVKEQITTSSTWSKIKTPLLIIGGIGIIFIAYKLFRSKLTNNS